MIIEELDIDLEPVDLFSRFAGEKGAVFLDCSKRTPHRRYSLMALSPALTFTSWGKSAFIERGGKAARLRGKPLEALRKIHEEMEVVCDAELPVGAAIGFVGYETGHTLEEIRTRPKEGLPIPDCFLNFYESLLLYDHVAERYIATSASGKIAGWIRRAARNSDRIEGGRALPPLPRPVSSSTSRADFLRSVERVREYIRRGEVYQVNLSQRFSSPFQDDPFLLYLRLRKICPVPYGAFMNAGEFQVLSLSPERFVRIDGRNVQTRPIKGTIARGGDAAEDAERRESLRRSVKDRAELLMITDLERNDLGRVCSPSTVSVPSLVGIEEYPNVFHLVSTIEGELAPDKTHLDCLAAVFPGGSITGAPKIRAMDVIEELEPVRRNVYTGAIGYIGYNGQTDLNIAIRTATALDGRIYFHGGGGIVIDSDPEMEYDETVHKVRPFLEALSPGSHERMLRGKEKPLP